MLKQRLDALAVRVTDEIAGDDGSIGDAAIVMQQILAGCEAHIEGIRSFAEEEESVLSDIRQMERAIYAAKMALLEMKTISNRTDGAL